MASQTVSLKPLVEVSPFGGRALSGLLCERSEARKPTAKTQYHVCRRNKSTQRQCCKCMCAQTYSAQELPPEGEEVSVPQCVLFLCILGCPSLVLRTLAPCSIPSTEHIIWYYWEHKIKYHLGVLVICKARVCGASFYPLLKKGFCSLISLMLLPDSPSLGSILGILAWLWANISGRKGRSFSTAVESWLHFGGKLGKL